MLRVAGGSFGGDDCGPGCVVDVPPLRRPIGRAALRLDRHVQRERERERERSAGRRGDGRELALARRPTRRVRRSPTGRRSRARTRTSRAEPGDGRRGTDRGRERLLSRIAMAINGVARRRGKVWRDRYFRQDLTAPKQVRNVLVYVLFNIRKHAQSDHELAFFRDRLDPYSSAAWLEGWSPASCPSPIALAARSGGARVAAPPSWLMCRGWQHRGLIRLDEQPRSRD